MQPQAGRRNPQFAAIFREEPIDQRARVRLISPDQRPYGGLRDGVAEYTRQRAAIGREADVLAFGIGDLRVEQRPFAAFYGKRQTREIQDLAALYAGQQCLARHGKLLALPVGGGNFNNLRFSHVPSICLDERVSGPNIVNWLQSASINLDWLRFASIDASGKRRARRARCIFSKTDCKIRRLKRWQLMDLKPPGFA